MKNEEERKYTMVKEGTGIKVVSNKSERVVVIYLDGASIFMKPEIAISVGSELIEESMPLFNSKEEFAQTFVNACAAKRGQPAISLEQLESSLRETFEEPTRFVIGKKDGKILLSIGNNMCLGMIPGEAKALAQLIIAKAEQIETSENRN